MPGPCWSKRCIKIYHPQFLSLKNYETERSSYHQHHHDKYSVFQFQVLRLFSSSKNAIVFDTLAYSTKTQRSPVFSIFYWRDVQAQGCRSWPEDGEADPCDSAHYIWTWINYVNHGHQTYITYHKHEYVFFSLGSVRGLVILVLSQSTNPGKGVRGIDYRCDDEKKRTIDLGWHLGINCVAEDSRIPKMPVINPFQAFVHPQTQKKTYPAWIANPQPQLLRIHLFW